MSFDWIFKLFFYKSYKDFHKSINILHQQEAKVVQERKKIFRYDNVKYQSRFHDYAALLFSEQKNPIASP